MDIMTGQCGSKVASRDEDGDVIRACPEDYQPTNTKPAEKGASVPLMHLVKQLIRNTSCQTQMQITAILTGDVSKTDEEREENDTVSPSCDLLIRFQR